MDEQQPKNVVDSSEGVWVLYRTATRSAFGRLKEIKELNSKTKEQVYGMRKNNQAILFDVVLDHFSPIRQVPITKDGKLQPDPNDPTRPLMGIGREMITTNFEFLLESCPVPVWGIEEMVFVEEMGPRDKRTARNMIDASLENILERRAQEVGVHIPTEGDLRRVSRLPNDENGKPHFKIDLR